MEKKKANTLCKKSISLLLALLLVLTAIPLGGLSAFAATSGDFEYSVISEADKTCELTQYTGSAAELTIPSEIDGYVVTSIGDRAFTSLANVTIPDSVTNISTETFRDCFSLTSIQVSKGNLSYSSENGVLFNREKTVLLRYPMKKTGQTYTIPNTVTDIADHAFDGCFMLSSIIIPNSVTNIGIETFSGCSALKNITLPDSVTNIGNSAFSSCESLESVAIPDGITSIGDCMFLQCTLLRSVIIPDSAIRIGERAFSSCENLKSISIPDSVTSIGDSAFYQCRSLTSITIPDSVTSIENTTFYQCRSLESVSFPDTITKIGDYAFYYCYSLTSITIPNSVTSIGIKAFSGCHSLKDLTISNGVTSIGVEAFSDCELLSEITIPDSVTSIGEKAFGYDYDTNWNLQRLKGFIIYGQKGSEAEKYANENEFIFIPLLEVKDNKTDISVIESKPGIIPEKATLKVENLEITESSITYDISLVRDGVAVQPNGKVIVKIPVPANMNRINCEIYRVEIDGTYTDMQAVYEDGYMVFTTDHFSTYVLTTKYSNVPAVTMGDVNNDGKVNAVDARWILQTASGERTLAEEQNAAADVNGDGKINAVDARWILQIASGERAL